MGVEGCTKCIKYLLFVFNFVFWLAGGVILGVALWLRHDPQTTNLLYLELGDRPAPNTFYVGIYILIAVGAVMMFVGFLGCYGAIQESQCLLGTEKGWGGQPQAARPARACPQPDPVLHPPTDPHPTPVLFLCGPQFFTCLVILFACEVAAGIWGFVNKDQIAKDVKQFYDQALQQAVVDDDANNAKAVVKTFHETLDCCGSSTLSKLTTSVLKNNLCPSGNIIGDLFKDDCHQKIDELFSGKLYLIGIAAIVVAVIMIFEMILSMVLCCGIRNSSVY
ncbi:CD81 antigen isoform X1 [Eulemur rufifrons]|uniref:CD81 antigen isoform X1 n=1 Tax=Eulemur rufifrons TaxID=859984 RepID=UPI0037427568